MCACVIGMCAVKHTHTSFQGMLTDSKSICGKLPNVNCKEGREVCSACLRQGQARQSTLQHRFEDAAQQSAGSRTSVVIRTAPQRV